MPQLSTNQVRIIGGHLRSRKLSFPDADGLRPTADRIRETLFNWLQFDLQGRHCLDLFAGSGVLGIEALSRGASSCIFIEKNVSAADAIAKNLSKLDLHSGNVLCADALAWLSKNVVKDSDINLIFLDPPFASDYQQLLSAVAEKDEYFPQDCKLYLESPVEVVESGLLQNWRRQKAQKAGKVYYSLWQKQPKKDN